MIRRLKNKSKYFNKLLLFDITSPKRAMYPNKIALIFLDNLQINPPSAVLAKEDGLIDDKDSRSLGIKDSC